MPNGLLDNWQIVKQLWQGFGNNPRNQETVDAMKGMAGLIPLGAGDVAAGLLAADDFRRGDYLSMAANGIGALPLIPALGGVLKNSGGDVAQIVKNTERTVASPKDVKVAKRFLSGGKEGIYRGSESFGGITPQRLGQMRKLYLDKMEQGAPGRMWYDESSADINRWTGGNVTDADRMANMLAITSSRTPVASNLMYANKGWNQHLVGDTIHTGGFPVPMGKHISEVADNPSASASGLKRSPFSAGLSVDWRGADFANRATHDIHDVRAWGIQDPQTGLLWSKGVPDAGHRFLDEQSAWVTDKANQVGLGGHTDWTPYRGQAAAWIAQKAKTDNIPIADAAKHYGSFAPDYQASITREWVPGDNTGHLPELLSAPSELKKQFSDTLESIVTGSNGIDDLARQSGALVDKTIPNVGFYEGGVNPGYVSMINVGKAKGSQAVDEASRKVANAVAAAHGLLGVQKQAAWNYGSSAGNPSYANTGAFLIDKAGINDLPKVQQIVTDTLGDGGVAMMHPSGIKVLSFDSNKNKQLYGLLSGAGSVQKQEVSGGLVPGVADSIWSAKPFIQAIEDSGKMRSKIDAAIRPKAGALLKQVEAMSAANGWTQAKYYKPMMEALRDGGIDALKELVKKGVVPVAVITALGLNVGQERDDSV